MPPAVPTPRDHLEQVSESCPTPPPHAAKKPDPPRPPRPSREPRAGVQQSPAGAGVTQSQPESGPTTCPGHQHAETGISGLLHTVDLLNHAKPSSRAISGRRSGASAARPSTARFPRSNWRRRSRSSSGDGALRRGRRACDVEPIDIKSVLEGAPARGVGRAYGTSSRTPARTATPTTPRAPLPRTARRTGRAWPEASGASPAARRGAHTHRAVRAPCSPRPGGGPHAPFLMCAERLSYGS